jgi:hypothetical protein
MQKMSRLGLQTPWNIATSNSPKTILKRTVGRSWDHKSIRLPKTSLPRIRRSHFFGRTRCRKLVRKAFSHLEELLYRLHQSRFSIRPEGRLWDLRASRLLEISLPRLRPSRFIRFQNAENEFPWSFDTLKNCFIDFTKVVSKTSSS